MSAEKTLEILDVFNSEERVLTVSQIAQRISQPQSSVYRYIRLLREKGFLIEQKTGSYSLSYKFLKYYRILQMDTDLVVIAKEQMRKLTSELKETSILLVYSNLHAICIATVSSEQKIKVASETGEIVPLYGGASSKALLAFLDEKIVEDLYKQTNITKYTSNTITDVEQMKEHLAVIRNQGYAYSNGEIDEGVTGYGVPIFDSNKNVVASLSVAGLEQRMFEKNENDIIDLLKKAVSNIQEYL